MLEQIPKFSEDFKIPQENASPVTDTSGYKFFTQTIRANNDKVTEVPPIPLTYFDADKGKYITIASSPIKLEVSPTRQADVEGGGESVPVKKEVKAVMEGLAANHEGQDVLINQEFSLAGAFLVSPLTIVWGVPFTALVASILLKVITANNPERAAAKRRRAALGKAIRQIKNIESAESRQRGEALAAALKQYAGERFDRTAGSLTAVDCFNLIADKTSDEEAAEKFKQLIEDCDSARYGAAELKIDSQMVRDVSHLLRLIDKKAKK